MTDEKAEIGRLRAENESLSVVVDELTRCLGDMLADLEDLKTRFVLAQKATIAHASVAQVALTYCLSYKDVAMAAIDFVQSDRRRAPQKLQDAVKKLEETIKATPKA